MFGRTRTRIIHIKNVNAKLFFLFFQLQFCSKDTCEILFDFVFCWVYKEEFLPTSLTELPSPRVSLKPLSGGNAVLIGPVRLCVCVCFNFFSRPIVCVTLTDSLEELFLTLTSFFGLTLLKLPAFQGRLSQTDAFTQWQSYHTAVQETRTNKPLCDSPVLHFSDLQTSSSRLLQTLKQKRKSKIVFTSVAPPAE